MPQVGNSHGSLILGRYVLYHEIGIGGMASVHIARHVGALGFCRTVAIKRLHEQFARDAEFVGMFLDEARLAARVNHPNVVSMLDVVTTSRELCLVMEYVHGADLARLLGQSGRMHPDQAVDPSLVSAIMVDALRGLNAAHEATDDDGERLQLVHRDVSPHNIFVGVDGITRVLDFGVAKATSRVQVTREGQVKGKLAYMSPEQILSKPVDCRSDVFAAGVVLWEMLTGRRLFAHDDAGASIHSILMRPRQAPSELRPAVSKALDEVVLCALAIEVEGRFPSAAAMATALEDACSPARPAQVSAWVNDLAGEQLKRQHDRIRAIEKIPNEQVADEVTRADVEITSSLENVLKGIEAGHERAEAPTAADVLATRTEGVGPMLMPVAPPTEASQPELPTLPIPEPHSEPHSEPRPRSSRRWLAVALVSLGVGGGIAAWASEREATDEDPRPTTRPVPPRVWVAKSSTPEAVLAPTSQSTGGPPVPTASAAALPLPPPRTPPATKPAPRPVQPPATGTPNCTPNYYYEDGIKRYKPHCF